MVTIKEIAQRAGVSIGTVDRVLHNRGEVNEGTKKRILEIVDELNYRPNLAAKGLAVHKKKLKLCFVLVDPKGHPFFSDVKIAVKKKAKELEQYGVQVIIKLINNNQLDMQVPESDFPVRLEELQEYDGLAILGITHPLVNRLLEKAKEIQLPVVCYNEESQERGELAYVGCDYVKAGRLAAGLSALAGGTQARVFVYSEATSYTSSHIERMRGFCTECRERYPGIKLLDVQEFSSNSKKNHLLAKDMLQKFPDVNVVYVVNPGDYSICKAIASADEKRQIRIITNDLVEGQREMVEEGLISATICQEPEKQGDMPLDILFQYLAYDILPENKMCYTDLSIIIAQNL